MTAGVGSLSVVASQEIGELGAHDSSPAAFEWRWYYHVPSIGVWGVLVALLVLVRANRRAQAWLIWLPVLAVALAWSMLSRLLFLSPDAAEPFGDFLTTLAASWAAAWLLAPWLAPRHFLAGVFLAVVAMVIVGGVYYLSVYDFRSLDEPVALSVLHVAGALSLVVATVLAASRCRQAYRPRRFLAWLLLWMLVIPMVCTPLVALVTVGSTLFWSEGLLEVVSMAMTMLVGSAIGGAVLGVSLYLLNLPFVALATRNEFYRARFLDVLRLVPAIPHDQGVAASTADVPEVETVPVTLVEES